MHTCTALAICASSSRACAADEFLADLLALAARDGPGFKPDFPATPGMVVETETFFTSDRTAVCALSVPLLGRFLVVSRVSIVRDGWIAVGCMARA